MTGGCGPLCESCIIGRAHLVVQPARKFYNVMYIVIMCVGTTLLLHAEAVTTCIGVLTACSLLSCVIELGNAYNPMGNEAHY